MNIHGVNRYYMLFNVIRSNRGAVVSQRKSRLIKRLLALNLLKREWKRLCRMAALAYEKQEKSCHTKPIFLHRKSVGAWYTLVPYLREDPKEHYNFFRMDVECFDFLKSKLIPLIRKDSYREPISVGQRLAVTLRYLASGNSQRSLSYLFRIANQTISTIVTETTAAIWFVLRRLVFEPLSPEFWRKKAAEFEQMWQFPMCVGAIDGRHCCAQVCWFNFIVTFPKYPAFTVQDVLFLAHIGLFQKFPGRGTENYTYKGDHSVVLLAVSDARYKFIAVDLGAKGKEADGGVFDRSEFGELFWSNALGLPPLAFNECLGENLPYVFVGDDAFTLDQHLMKPFSGDTLKPEEVIFNYRLSRARRVVENAFGVLTAKWRILRERIIGSETLVQNVIQACVVLHNWHLMREESIPPSQRVYLREEDTDVYLSNGFLKPGRWRNEVGYLEDTIFHRLVTEEDARSNNQQLEAGMVREKFVELFVGDPLP